MRPVDTAVSAMDSSTIHYDDDDGGADYEGGSESNHNSSVNMTKNEDIEDLTPPLTVPPLRQLNSPQTTLPSLTQIALGLSSGIESAAQSSGGQASGSNACPLVTRRIKPKTDSDESLVDTV